MKNTTDGYWPFVTIGFYRILNPIPSELGKFALTMVDSQSCLSSKRFFWKQNKIDMSVNHLLLSLKSDSNYIMFKNYILMCLIQLTFSPNLKHKVDRYARYRLRKAKQGVQLSRENSNVHQFGWSLQQLTKLLFRVNSSYKLVSPTVETWSCGFALLGISHYQKSLIRTLLTYLVQFKNQLQENIEWLHQRNIWKESNPSD